MLQAGLGMAGGIVLVVTAGRALYVMAREEFRDVQADLESGYQKRRAEDFEDPELGLEEPEVDSYQTREDLSYVEYDHDQQHARPESPVPSVPSMIRVPAPGSTFPPPPPPSRCSRNSSDAVVVAEPVEPVETAEPSEPVEPYTHYLPPPEVAEEATHQTEFRDSALIPPPASGPAPDALVGHS